MAEDTQTESRTYILAHTHTDKRDPQTSIPASASVTATPGTRSERASSAALGAEVCLLRLRCAVTTLPSLSQRLISIFFYAICGNEWRR